MEETINRAVRTAVKDTTNYNEVMLARNQILRGSMQYLTRHQGTLQEYTEAVYKLTEAEMSRSEALRSAPTVMALAKGLDAPIETTTKLLVGLNELYKKSMPGLDSDSARINKISGMLALASKKEMASVEQLTTGLSYFGALGKQVNMPIEQLVSLTAVLNTNLLQGSKAGTGLRQVLNSITKNAPKLNQAFNLGIDTSKPIDVFDVLQRLQKQLGAGTLTGARLQQLLGGFELRGATAAVISAQQIDRIMALTNQLKMAGLENVFSMRDIMETNVPAQFEIFAKNIDYVGAAFLRGAVGGDSMAKSIKNINAMMPELQVGAKAMGDVMGILTTKAGVAAGALVGIALLVRKVRAASAWPGKLAGVGGLAALGVGIAQYGFERWQEQQQRNMEKAQTAYENSRTEIAGLEQLRQVISNASTDTETLTKAKELLAKAARNAGESFDTEKMSAQQLLGVIDTLSKKQKEMSDASFSEYLAASRRYIVGLSLRDPMTIMENGLGTLTGIGGTANLIKSLVPNLVQYMSNSPAVLDRARQVAEAMKERGSSKAEISAKMAEMLSPALREADKYESIEGMSKVPLAGWLLFDKDKVAEFVKAAKTFRAALQQQIDDPLKGMNETLAEGANRLATITGRLSGMFSLLGDLSRNYFIGREVTGPDGKKTSIRGRRFASSFLSSVDRQRNREQFGKAFDQNNNISGIIADIAKGRSPKDANQMLQAFLIGGNAMLDKFPELADIIRQRNPAMLGSYSSYRKGGVYGMANEFARNTLGRGLSAESVNALIQTMAGNDSDLAQNTQALKDLTDAIKNNMLDPVMPGPEHLALSGHIPVHRKYNYPAFSRYGVAPKLDIDQWNERRRELAPTMRPPASIARHGAVQPSPFIVQINLNDEQLATFVSDAGKAISEVIPVAADAAAKAEKLMSSARAVAMRRSVISNTKAAQ